MSEINMHNVTSSFSNNFPRHQQQFPSQSQAPTTNEAGHIEKISGSDTSINKNQGRGNVSRQLQKTSASIERTSDPDLKTIKRSASSIKELLNNFAEKKKANPEMQIALVSGGSVAGHAAALTLNNCGFHVIIAENRQEYTRENSLLLKEEALHALTKLSPDGTLVKDLINNELMDTHKSRTMRDGGLLAPDGRELIKEATPVYRLMNWLTNNDKIHSSAKIPVRVKRDRETAEFLDLPFPPLPPTSTKKKKYQPLGNQDNEKKRKPFRYLDHDIEKKREPLEYLDLAWPEHEAVIPVDPKEWKYSNLGKIGQENLGLCKIRNLEKGLNQHCLKQDNIDVISAEIFLKETDSEDFKYSPTFIVADNGKKEHIDSSFHFDLICIAEGANSKNAATISEQTIIPKVESWFQANFPGPKSNLGAQFGAVFDKNKKQMTAIHYIGVPEGSFINMSLGIEPDKKLVPDFIDDAMKNTRQMCEAGGANVEISMENMKLCNAKADGEHDEISMKNKFESARVDVDIKRANTVMRSNVVIIGDAAGSGSPVGALGGSLALSAYPEMIERLVKHPDFKDLKDPEKRQDVELFFRKGVAQIVNLRHGIPSEIMRKLGMYPLEVNERQFKNGILALFPDGSDA